MTILQKMLIVPVCSLLLYGLYIFYSYSEHRESTERIEQIRHQYAPLLTLTNENIRLFNQVRERHKDAVVAAEQHWLLEARTLQTVITTNLTEIAQYQGMVAAENIATLQHDLQSYFTYAEQFAQRAIADQSALLSSDQLLENLDRYQRRSASGLVLMQSQVSQGFNSAIDDINRVMDRLLLLGSTISVALLLFLLAVTFWVSYSTYQRVSEVVGRMRSLAEGSTDFSQRLRHTGKDELGYLIYWFNKLSDKLEQSYLDLEKVSITDKLTQLNNRTRTDIFLPKAIERAKSQQRPLSVALLDIDHFKSINDSHGHPIGDAVLRQFAQVLRDHAGEHDFVARWGGEEFIMLLQNCAVQQATEQLERLREQVAQDSFPHGETLTVSIGFSVLHDTDTTDSLVKRADENLYRAKALGRNRVLGEQ